MNRHLAPSRWLLPALMAALAILAGCSDLGPSQPQVGEPLPGGFGEPPPALAPIDSTLDSQQELWSSMGIDSYQYRFRWQCYCLDSYVRIVDINVQAGVVVSVKDVQSGRDLGPEAIAAYRTIDGLFDMVRQARDQPASSARVAYHPELGYPMASEIDWVGQAIDDEVAFRVYRLIPHKTQ